MEKKLDKLEIRVEKVEEALDTILNVATTRKNIEIIEETENENKEEETHDEGDRKSNKLGWFRYRC